MAPKVIKLGFTQRDNSQERERGRKLSIVCYRNKTDFYYSFELDLKIELELDLKGNIFVT